MEISLDIIVLLAAAAFVAGFIDSIAGGGGLITIPALMLAGLAPVDALGTNKLQGLFGTGAASIAYAANGHVDLAGQWRSALLAFGGSVAGAAIAALMPADVLGIVMPILLVAIALYFALKPRMDDIDRVRRMSPFLFTVLIVPIIGFYDGIFGPGTGSFFMLAFVALAGYGVLKATAHTKLLNFASNIGGFATFALAGAVAWKIGLVMGAMQVLGARLGARLAMRTGARLIKPLLVVTCVAMAARLLMDEANPIRMWIMS